MDKPHRVMQSPCAAKSLESADLGGLAEYQACGEGPLVA